MRTTSFLFGTALLLGSLAAGTVQAQEVTGGEPVQVAQANDPGLTGTDATGAPVGVDTGSGGTEADTTGSGGFGEDTSLPQTGGDPLSMVAAGAALSGVGFALLRRRRALK